jgi:hypothetical protein
MSQIARETSRLDTTRCVMAQTRRGHVDRDSWTEWKGRDANLTAGTIYNKTEPCASCRKHKEQCFSYVGTQQGDKTVVVLRYAHDKEAQVWLDAATMAPPPSFVLGQGQPSASGAAPITNAFQTPRQSTTTMLSQARSMGTTDTGPIIDVSMEDVYQPENTFHHG